MTNLIVRDMFPRVRDEFFAPVESLFDSLLTEFFTDFRPIDVNKLKGRAYPKTDARVDGKDLVFEAAIPFLDKEDLKITLDDGVLTISGKIEDDKKVESHNFVMRELTRSAFTRRFPLHRNLYEKWNQNQDANSITADLKDGILTIRLVNFMNGCLVENPCTTTREIEIS